MHLFLLLYWLLMDNEGCCRKVSEGRPVKRVIQQLKRRPRKTVDGHPAASAGYSTTKPNKSGKTVPSHAKSADRSE